MKNEKSPIELGKPESDVLFSFIVPIYNAERYLRQCLFSILNQTTGNWEAVLVDDGSTDSSGSIADEFAALDARFRVVHQNNQGTSGATNTAFSLVRGSYIVNLDNDDYVSSLLLERATKLINDYQPDVIQFPPIFITPEGIEIERYSLIQKRQVANTYDEMESFLSIMGDGFLRSHSQKIIRRATVGDLRFKGPSKGADVSFVRRLLFRSERAILEPDYLFYVRIRADSETHRPTPPLLYKEWFAREMEDLGECLSENVARCRRAPFWVFDDLFDLVKLFAAKSIIDRAYDRRFFSHLFTEMTLQKSYLIKNSARSRLSFFAWKHFTKVLSMKLSRKIEKTGQLF